MVGVCVCYDCHLKEGVSVVERIWIVGKHYIYIQALHQRKVLITEQQVNDTNPVFELAIITQTGSNHNLSTYNQAQ
jgi:hypothetical protein